MEEKEYTIKITGDKRMMRKLVDEIEEAREILGFPSEELDMTDNYGYESGMIDFFGDEIIEQINNKIESDESKNFEGGN